MDRRGRQRVLRFDRVERGFVDRLDDHWRIFLDGSYKVGNAATLPDAKAKAEALVEVIAVQKLMRRQRATGTRR